MDERSQDEHNEKRNGLDSIWKKLYQPVPLIILFSVAFLCLVWLGYYLLQADAPPPAVIHTEPVPYAESTSSPRIYEEDTSTQLEDRVKQADLSIIETMRELGLDMNALQLLDVSIKQHQGYGFHFQTLGLPGEALKSSFLQTLTPKLAERVPDALIREEPPNMLVIGIGGEDTHRLVFKQVALPTPRPQQDGPVIAVVIDDIGESMHLLKGLAQLDYPVTFAVWPHATHTREAVETVLAAHMDLIIHFPMEPKGYPRYNPGDDALFVSMNQDQILQQIADNIAQIPEAVGVNNHMGSRFTAYEPGMRVALGEFKRRGLFFLDSLTIGKSVGRQVAKEVQIPFYERDVFIDNVKDVTAILFQLKKAEKVAMKQGWAIAIGHPYKETLAALRQWKSQKNTAIQLVPLTSIRPE